MIGRFRIPSLFIDIPLYKSCGNAQEIVDAPQSAAWIEWRNMIAIADHASQSGMWRLKWAIPRLTRAIVEMGGKRTYICTKKQRGIIDGGYMIDASGRVVNGMIDIELVIYTCTGRTPGGNTEVWLTFWKEKAEAPPW